MTPPDAEKQSKPARRSPPLWRLAFDLVERPVGAASESLVQSEVFMDALAASWKVQRRMTRGCSAASACGSTCSRCPAAAI